MGDELYFTATDGVHGKELWKSDGTTAGTVMVYDIRAGSANSAPSFLTVVGTKIFFEADDGIDGSTGNIEPLRGSVKYQIS